jgi:recombination protein U
MGRKSIMGKNPGKKFEEDFVKSIPDRCDITRLKDAGGWSNATNTRFTISNPCDFVVFSQPKDEMDQGSYYKLELKSVKGISLPFTNIKDSQLKALMESQTRGVLAWFIVNFRQVNETYAVAAHLIAGLIEKGDRKSLPLEYARKNCLLIKQSIIKVRWRYDLSWL